jgi:hypothetical protein
MTHVQGHHKRAPRIDLRRPAVIVNSDGTEWDVTILDVSRGGFRMEVSECPRIGELITLRVEHSEEIPAQIRWVLGNEAGGSFIGPTDAVAGAEQGDSQMTTEKSDQAADRRSETDRRESERRLSDERRRDERSTDRRKGERRKGPRRDS